MASDGISRLITVTQQKSENANDEAMSGANKQRSIIKAQESLKSVQKTFDEKVRDSSVQGSEFSATKAGTVSLEATVAKPADYLRRYSRSGFEGSSKFPATDLIKNLDLVGSSPTRFASGIGAFATALKKALEESKKHFEAKDKLGNFEIQRLMSAFNQAETLASSVKKKMDDQNSSVIGKIG